MRLALLLVAVVGCAPAGLRPRAPTPGRPHVTLMTYNVNFAVAPDASVMRALERTDADVVLLQETTPAWEAALRARLASRYPVMLFRHCCRAGGLAVLSRHPVVDLGTTQAPGTWFPAWRVVVRSSLGPLQVLNLHLRPGVSDGGSYISGAWTTPRVRLREIAHHFRFVDPSLPTVVAGDLNEGHGGQAVHFLEARGLRDALPAFEGPQSTWRWATSVGTLRLQLDHVLYSATLRPLYARVVRAGRSDHLPVVAAFERVDAPM